MSITTHRRHRGDFTWEDIPVLAYKQADTAPFRDVTRQVLFEDAQLGCQLRYFEIAPAGHTTLERHQHLHARRLVAQSPQHRHRFRRRERHIEPAYRFLAMAATQYEAPRRIQPADHIHERGSGEVQIARSGPVGGIEGRRGDYHRATQRRWRFHMLDHERRRVGARNDAWLQFVRQSRRKEVQRESRVTRA